MTVDNNNMELSNSRDITISTCGGEIWLSQMNFLQSSSWCIYTYYYYIQFIWRADSPRRKQATEGPDYSCELPTPRPPQFPRYSHCVCAQIILFGPLCKSPAVWFMPNNSGLGAETRFQCHQMFRSRRLFIMGLCIIIIFI